MDEKLKYRSILRKVHQFNPDILSPSLLNAARPTPDELDGSRGLRASGEIAWEETSATAPYVIVKLQISSDGVRPKKTLNSHLRAIMGSVDTLVSPHLNRTTPLPNAPPFIIGLYSGPEENEDGALRGLVRELKDLEPNIDIVIHREEDGRDVYATISVYIADDKERRCVCGTVAHNGLLGCPRCLVVGNTKLSKWQMENFTEEERKKITNGTYFADLNADPRLDADWNSYLNLNKLPGEVILVIYVNTSSIYMYGTVL